MLQMEQPVKLCTCRWMSFMTYIYCWAPHDAILYESGRSEEYYLLISECLDCSNHMVGAVQRSFGWPAVLDRLGIRTDAVSLVHALHVAISPVNSWF